MSSLFKEKVHTKFHPNQKIQRIIVVWNLINNVLSRQNIHQIKNIWKLETPIIMLIIMLGKCTLSFTSINSYRPANLLRPRFHPTLSAFARMPPQPQRTHITRRNTNLWFNLPTNKVPTNTHTETHQNVLTITLSAHIHTHTKSQHNCCWCVNLPKGSTNSVNLQVEPGLQNYWFYHQIQLLSIRYK